MRLVAVCAALAGALLVTASAPAESPASSRAGAPAPADSNPPVGAGEPTAARARREAETILAEPRFSPPDLPRPLAGPLEALGEEILDAFSWLARRLPGGGATVWGLLGGAVLLIAFAVAGRLARRRAPAARARSRTGDGGGQAPEDPVALEREAERAERNGQLGRALRARFRAGLLRLDAAERITLRPSLTTGEIAGRLRSPEFDSLTATFEAVAYGGREPDRAAVEAQRAGWRRLLDGSDRG